MSISTAVIPSLERHSDFSQHCCVDIELVEPGEPERAEIERFIRVVFRRAYGARVSHFLPYLLSMRQEGRILAALGIRPAADTPLFLEAYLPAPVESVLAGRSRMPIDRSRIVEVGNLASCRGGSARALIVTLTAYLEGAGYEWVVFTATPKVRNNFAKLGIELVSLGLADKQCLGDAQHDWGSYYEQGPQVVAANIAEGVGIVLAAMDSQALFPMASRLWEDAFQAGRQGRLWQPPRVLGGQWPGYLLDATCDFEI